MLAKWKRLYYTLSPLKGIQLWGLFYYRVVRRLMPFRPVVVKPTEIEQVTQHFGRYQEPSWLGKRSFVFLNQTAEVTPDWLAPQRSLLWLYNLHYFDYLHTTKQDDDNKALTALVIDWWEYHQERQGVAWDPYPSSLRAVNLCKWHWLHNQDFSLIDQVTMSQMLARHYVEIKRKLEYHIQANHLFANIKALLFLQAALPSYRKKDQQWLLKQLSTELHTQFDKQGGHFELSPMYHRIMLWDLLDILALSSKVMDFQSIVPRLTKVCEQALVWVDALSHPDQEVSFFNDGSIGIAPVYTKLNDYVHSLGINKEQELNAPNGIYSGYAVYQNEGAKLICDVAPVGPLFQPGHAHADSLSFEFSIGTQRIFVNSGTSEYGSGPERLRQRSTSAHNTLVYDGRNSSDVWSGFRVGKAAKIKILEQNFNPERFVLTASHDGYAPVVYTRTWELTKNKLIIHDACTGNKKKDYYFYLHPNIKVQKTKENKLKLNWLGGAAEVEISAGELTVQETSWHPNFGTSIATKCLKITTMEMTSSIYITYIEED